MPFQVLAPEAEPCVWMCAGLISYRLCDHGFDCESCLLDAALRGHMEAGGNVLARLDRRVAQGLFPADRMYSPGHLWVRAFSHADACIWQVGLDAFAAALIGCVTAVRSVTHGGAVQRGDTVCEVDLGFGVLEVTSPVSGRFLRGNRELGIHPHQLVTDPYSAGWILAIEGADAGSVLKLHSATVASQQTLQDLRRFRRSLALRLLTASGATAQSSAEVSESIQDLRQILCGEHYADLLSQFVH